ncbi:MAG: hypothetical protein V3576_06385 [Candidatus Cloacimonadota bacterium]
MTEQPQASMGIRKRMLINTMSNYGKMILGMAITIFLTRILFLGLTREEYGFWALLWSIFGYSLLLDFGFGTSIQKYTSECSVSQDWEKYNRIVSTVFFNYCIFALLIAGFTILMSFNLTRLFQFSNSDPDYFRRVFLLFGFGSALAFPFGFYTEILRGLQMMHTRNLIQISFTTLNFVGMALMIHLKLNLTGMVFVALGTNICASLVMMLVVHRLIPRFRIRLKYYDLSLLRSVMGFSVFAYLITFTNVIILKTDQLVISLFGSVALVAVYQISVRLAETYRQFSAQFLDNLGPVAATLFAAGNKSKLTEVLLQSNRLMGMISSLLLIPLLVYVKPLLKLWLNLDHTAGLICAVILLLSMYTLLFFRSSSVYVLLMSGEQRILAKIALLEAGLNLGLSIALMRLLPGILEAWGVNLPDASIIGVALGTLLPNLVLAFSFNIPKACRFAGIKVSQYFRIVVLRTALTTALGFAFAWGLYRLAYPQKLITVLIYSALTGIFYLALSYFIGLEGWERSQAQNFIRSKLNRRS